MTILTRSVVSQSGAGFKSNADVLGEEEEAEDKLTMAAAVDRIGGQTSKHVQHSVLCQNPNDQHVRENNGGTEVSEAQEEQDMPRDRQDRQDRTNASKFQSRLMVTLKTPPRAEAKAEAKLPRKAAPIPSRVFQPIRFGIRPEFQTLPVARFATPGGKEGSLPRSVGGGGSVERLPLAGGAQRPLNGAVKGECVMMDGANIPEEQGHDQVGESSIFTACLRTLTPDFFILRRKKKKKIKSSRETSGILNRKPKQISSRWK